MNPSRFAKTRLKNSAKMWPKKFVKKLRLALMLKKMYFMMLFLKILKITLMMTN